MTETTQAKRPGRFTLVLGGARSGKSGWAERCAQERAGGAVLYVATAQGLDDEMRDRIARHRTDRAAHGWQTLEAPVAAGSRLREGWDGRSSLVLLDCATLWISNILCMDPMPASEREADARVKKEFEAFLAAWRGTGADLIVVSNEVGLGLVPPTPLGRLFRDAQGRANQWLAKTADDVVFMVAGLPMIIKGKA